MIDIQQHEGKYSGLLFETWTLRSNLQGGFLSAAMLYNKDGYKAEAVSDSLNGMTVGLHWTDGDPIVAEFFVKYGCLRFRWSYVVLT